MDLWIARDKKGYCYVSLAKPYDYKGEWLCEYGKLFIGKADDLSEVTYENSPQKVKLKLI